MLMKRNFLRENISRQDGHVAFTLNCALSDVSSQFSPNALLSMGAQTCQCVLQKRSRNNMDTQHVLKNRIFKTKTKKNEEKIFKEAEIFIFERELSLLSRAPSRE